MSRPLTLERLGVTTFRVARATGAPVIGSHEATRGIHGLALATPVAILGA